MIGSPRGVGKSESGGVAQWDSYDLIEWIAAQPWCDGKVGMIGICGFAAEQFHAAKQQPPHLKAIFPFDPRGAYGTLGGFREEYPGGVLHLFRYLIMHFAAMHGTKGRPGALPPETRGAVAGGDAQSGLPDVSAPLQRADPEGSAHAAVLRSADRSVRQGGDGRGARSGARRDHDPGLHRCGWYGYTYKTHLNGAQNYFEKICRHRRS